MLTNEDLLTQASGLESKASELASYLKTDPTLPPLETGEAAIELDRIKIRLNKLARKLRAASKDDS